MQSKSNMTVHTVIHHNNPSLQMAEGGKIPSSHLEHSLRDRHAKNVDKIEVIGP